jgi:NAD(P)-dependent dehydrogenase (short-subunit alcohol dehydrogenase family)
MDESRKVAIITGASHGIGAALVAGYLRAGYAVVGTARTMPAPSSPDLLTVEGDITDPDTSTRVVDLTLERYGHIDTLINDAGIYIEKPFTDYTFEDYTTITEVNLKGFFLITQPVIRHMLTRGGGHIVNISTSLVERADSTRPSALAVLTKGGLAAVTRSLAVEYASRGLRANAVSLGVIRTSTEDPKSYDALAALHPLGRVGELDDVVEGILYLERASFVTGEILHIDGGQTVGQ